MTKAKPGYYFFTICANCGKEIVLHPAPSPDEEDFPTSISTRVTCPHCGTEHTYKPSEMGRGEVVE
jgi:DNA-directed RNA polymerase subunit RPC12/RpoP